MLILVVLLEFFYSEAPRSMRGLCTALSWCWTALGYFLSSWLFTLANSVSRQSGSTSDLTGTISGGTSSLLSILSIFLTICFGLSGTINKVHWQGLSMFMFKWPPFRWVHPTSYLKVTDDLSTS